jgi:hypothetical protein
VSRQPRNTSQSRVITLFPHTVNGETVFTIKRRRAAPKPLIRKRRKNEPVTADRPSIPALPESGSGGLWFAVCALLLCVVLSD